MTHPVVHEMGWPTDVPFAGPFLFLAVFFFCVTRSRHAGPPRPLCGPFSPSPGLFCNIFFPLGTEADRRISAVRFGFFPPILPHCRSIFFVTQAVLTVVVPGGANTRFFFFFWVGRGGLFVRSDHFFFRHFPALSDRARLVAVSPDVASYVSWDDSQCRRLSPNFELPFFVRCGQLFFLTP